MSARIREGEIEICRPNDRPKRLAVLFVSGDLVAEPPLTIIEIPTGDGGTGPVRFLARIPEVHYAPPAANAG